jgi:hypothetical protein
MMFELPYVLRSIIWTRTKDSRARLRYDHVVRQIRTVGKPLLELMESDAEYEKRAYIGPTLLRLAAHMRVLHVATGYVAHAT